MSAAFRLPLDVFYEREARHPGDRGHLGHWSHRLGREARRRPGKAGEQHTTREFGQGPEGGKTQGLDQHPVVPPAPPQACLLNRLCWRAPDARFHV